MAAVTFHPATQQHPPGHVRLYPVIVYQYRFKPRQTGISHTLHVRCIRSARFPHGQAHFKGAPVSFLAFHADAAAQQAGQPCRYRKSQTESRLRVAGVQPLECPEQAFLSVLTDAHARITDKETQQTVCIPYSHMHVSRRGELHGVGQQVVQYLCQTQAVTFHHRVHAFGFHRHSQPFPVCQCMERVQHIPNHPPQMKCLLVRLFLSRFQTVVVKQVVRQSDDITRGIQYVFGITAALYPVPLFRYQLGIAVYGVQRGAQVMAHGQQDVLPGQ